MNTISTRVEGKGQTVDYIEHIRHRAGTSTPTVPVVHFLRVHIHNDSAVFQSWGRVERWDGTQWHEVVSVRGDALLMEHGAGYTKGGPTPGLFLPDRDRLVTLAREVLV